MSNAGILDICPCLSLTFRDRTNLIRFSNEEKDIDKLDSSNNWSFKVSSTGDKYLAHECYITSSENVQAHLHTSLFLEKKRTTTVLLQSRYRVEFPAYSKSLLTLGSPIFACPHINLLSFIGSKQAKEKGGYECLSCQTVFRIVFEPPLETLFDRPLETPVEALIDTLLDSLLDTSSSPEVVVVDVTRPLGEKGWPADEHWYRQSRIRKEMPSNRSGAIEGHGF
ncbi:hypothetical protein ASPZODRAFT_139637 [Penicilliopsis zonata CBS 506.65]|uniref:Uncharacterized protein n=1 Tax=Penicilliopsis zonata CBS 506.65 TaxID=1073090 RepID=A0A1L9ST02_9EURO|nr:hypothetical protein ASPZODRAFT_139637 [Penicilliopsis zonata CBS 506.65]OJJ50335.1 hypothetical protein ASPZODRAFT_139637 [Penicilliopsis zonata CBS 506.65]